MGQISKDNAFRCAISHQSARSRSTSFYSPFCFLSATSRVADNGHSRRRRKIKSLGKASSTERRSKTNRTCHCSCTIRQGIDYFPAGRASHVFTECEVRGKPCRHVPKLVWDVGPCLGKLFCLMTWRNDYPGGLERPAFSSIPQPNGTLRVRRQLLFPQIIQIVATTFTTTCTLFTDTYRTVDVCT